MLAYVTNEEKTEDTLVTGLNCSTKYNDAYEDMKFNFEMYSGERFFKRSIKSDTAKRERQKIRLHHYIQSFKPGEVTPEEAHKIGVEWAEKVFGKKHMVLCATHTDRGHIHNHFAVCPYDMYGKHRYANKKSMRMCRAISDEIALAHGLEIIEHPKKSYDPSKCKNWDKPYGAERFIEEKYPYRPQIIFIENYVETTVFDSKIGGIPYMPAGFKYPTVKDGKDKGEPIPFLAQMQHCVH